MWYSTFTHYWWKYKSGQQCYQSRRYTYSMMPNSTPRYILYRNVCAHVCQKIMQKYLQWYYLKIAKTLNNPNASKHRILKNKILHSNKNL